MGLGFLAPWVLGEFAGMARGAQARAAIQPYLENLEAQPTASETLRNIFGGPVGPGHATPTLPSRSPLPEMPLEWRNAMASAGLLQRLPSETPQWVNPLASVGAGPQGQIALQDAIARYNEEKEAEDEAREAVEAYRTGLQTSIEEQQEGLQDVLGQRREGLWEAQQQYRSDVSDIDVQRGFLQSTTAAQIADINANIERVRTEGEAHLAELRTMGREAIESSRNHAATMMEDTTTAYNARFQLQRDEIEGRTDIPAAARQALIQRAGYVNGSETRSMIAKVWGEEEARLDDIRMDAMQNMSGAIQSVMGAWGGAVSSGITAKAGLTETMMAETGALTRARAELGRSFTDQTLEFRSTMTNAASAVRNNISGLRTAGAVDLANLIASIPRAYVELGSMYGGILAETFAVTGADYEYARNELSAAAAAWGIESAAASPYQQAGFQTTLQAFMNDRYPPQQSGSNAGTSLGTAALGNEQLTGSVTSGLTGLFGSGAGAGAGASMGTLSGASAIGMP